VRRNSEYKAHRSEDFGMAAPSVLLASPGFFGARMKSRGRLGGRHKVPRVIADLTLLRSLEEFLRSRGSSEGVTPSRPA
jgi:hypothetical protein